MGVEIRRVIAAWLQRNHWRREARAWRKRYEELLVLKCAMESDHRQERSGLLDRALQAAKLNALPRQTVAKPVPAVTAKPEEPELDEMQQAIRDAYISQARDAGLSAAEGMKMFEAFRQGKEYSYTE